MLSLYALIVVLDAPARGVPPTYDPITPYAYTQEACADLLAATMPEVLALGGRDLTCDTAQGLAARKAWFADPANHGAF